jgi:Cu/Ag efflux protein CusF
VATVQKIDRKLRIVTLRGPERTMMVEVPPDIPLQNLKVGENIRAEFASAAAIQITRDGKPIK